MKHQWQRGCLNCGEDRKTFNAETQMKLIRADGNKTVVGLCAKCYELDSFDYEHLKNKLSDSEIDYARTNGTDSDLKFAESFRDLQFIGHEK